MAVVSPIPNSRESTGVIQNSDTPVPTSSPFSDNKVAPKGEVAPKGGFDSAGGVSTGRLRLAGCRVCGHQTSSEQCPIVSKVIDFLANGVVPEAFPNRQRMSKPGTSTGMPSTPIGSEWEFAPLAAGTVYLIHGDPARLTLAPFDTPQKPLANTAVRNHDLGFSAPRSSWLAFCRPISRSTGILFSFAK